MVSRQVRVVDISSDSIQIFGFTDQRWDVRFSLSTGHTDEARLSYTNVTRKTARRQVLPLLSAATNLSLAVGGVGVGVRGAVGRETGPGEGAGLAMTGPMLADQILFAPAVRYGLGECVNALGPSVGSASHAGISSVTSGKAELSDLQKQKSSFMLL